MQSEEVPLGATRPLPVGLFSAGAPSHAMRMHKCN